MTTTPANRCVEALERIPAYWLGRAWVRAQLARDLQRATSDTSAEALAEYRVASQYEARATALTGHEGEG